MYSPDKMYGFAEGEEGRVFFHLEAFISGPWGGEDIAPPPIVGEVVEVDFTQDPENEGRAPRARLVERVAPPTQLKGMVETFNAEKGWGFIRSEDGSSYYLHRSEVEDRRLPVPGQQVSFVGGFKNGRPRACYVKVGRLDG